MTAISEFVWEERISGFQRLLLKVSSIAGAILFFVGIQFVVRGRQQEGGIISGFGMFIAVQMRWGIKSLFNWIEGSHGSWLERFGYANLFWLLFIAAFIIDSLGVMSLFFYATDYASTLIK